jgi:hypothetical protein
MSLGGAVAAHADAIPGATYNGTTSDGGKAQITLSSDGTLVSSFTFSGIAPTCQWTTTGTSGNTPGGDASSWSGAPVTNSSFSFVNSLQTTTVSGTFGGGQSVSGTIRFKQNPSDGTCDSGSVQWTATTTATAPSGGNGGGGNGGGGTGTGGGGTGTGTGGAGNGHKVPRYATLISVRDLTNASLGGRLSSQSKSCVSGRMLVLWRGKRKIASAKSHSNGSYAFTRSAKIRGKLVHVTVATHNGSAAVCGAVTSKNVTA